jgi:hypothetical protein
MRTDGRTSMMSLVVAFHNFVRATKEHNGVDDSDCEGCDLYQPRHETKVRTSLIILRMQRKRTVASNHVRKVMILPII